MRNLPALSKNLLSSSPNRCWPLTEFSIFFFCLICEGGLLPLLPVNMSFIWSSTSSIFCAVSTRSFSDTTWGWEREFWLCSNGKNFIWRFQFFSGLLPHLKFPTLRFHMHLRLNSFTYVQYGNSMETPTIIFGGGHHLVLFESWYVCGLMFLYLYNVESIVTYHLAASLERLVSQCHKFISNITNHKFYGYPYNMKNITALTISGSEFCL